MSSEQAANLDFDIDRYVDRISAFDGPPFEVRVEATLQGGERAYPILSVSSSRRGHAGQSRRRGEGHARERPGPRHQPRLRPRHSRRSCEAGISICWRGLSSASRITRVVWKLWALAFRSKASIVYSQERGVAEIVLESSSRVKGESARVRPHVDLVEGVAARL